MLDIDKCKWLIDDKIQYDSKYFEYPMIEENYWAPLALEFSKDVNETIAFWETLTSKEFMYSLDVLDEIVQNTKSQKILEAVKRIGIEKKCDIERIKSRIKNAKCWIEDDD